MGRGKSQGIMLWVNAMGKYYEGMLWESADRRLIWEDGIIVKNFLTKNYFYV